jgi:small subunit ribosomal protein S16
VWVRVRRARQRPRIFKELIMVVIRLARGGAKQRPFYNIVAAHSRNRRDGRFLERVGFYNPMAAGGEEGLRVAFDRVEHWKSHGAQLTTTVARLVEQAKAKAAAPAPAAG